MTSSISCQSHYFNQIYRAGQKNEARFYACGKHIQFDYILSISLAFFLCKDSSISLTLVKRVGPNVFMDMPYLVVKSRVYQSAYLFILIFISYVHILMV